MMCEVATHDFNNQGLGCNISVNNGSVSPKKGFFDSFRGKSSPKSNLRKSKENSWSNIFGKKSDAKRKEEDDRTAELISQLQLEGRSDEEIAMHLSFINDIHTVPSPAPAPVAAPASPPRKKSKGGFFRFFRMIADEFSLTEEGYMIDDSTLQNMTISLAAAPFFGAPPPNMGVPFEELAMLEPICLGKRENNLPVCKHDGTPLPGNQTNCPVCLCEFTKGEKLKSLPCVHFYHKECIDRWLMVGNSCPLCKANVE